MTDLRDSAAAPEEVVAGLWTVLLGHRPHPDSDFFDLGGDSLAAARLTSRVNKALGVKSDVPLVYENRQLRPYVDALRNLGSVQPEHRTPASPQPDSDGWSTRLSFNKRKRLGNMARRERLRHPRKAKNIPLVLELVGPPCIAHLEAALADVIRRQPALRTAFEFRDEPLRWRALEDVAAPSIPVHDLPADASWHDWVQRLMSEPVPVDRPPLLRAHVLRREPPASALLVLVVEHLVSDGFSIEILRHELLTAYAARARGVVPELGAAPVHPQILLADRDEHLQHHPESVVDAWRAALEGLDDAPELDLAPPRPGITLPRPAEHREVRIDTPRWAQVSTWCCHHGFSETAVVLTAVYLTLHRTTGRTDLALVMAHAGRDVPEAEGLIDWFAELMIVRCRVDGDPSGHDLGAVVEAVQHEMWEGLQRPISFTYLMQQLRGVPVDASPGFPWVFVSFLKQQTLDVATTGLQPIPLDLPAFQVAFPGPIIEATAADDGLAVSVITGAGRYEQGVVDRFVEELESTLTDLATRPWAPRG